MKWNELPKQKIGLGPKRDSKASILVRIDVPNIDACNSHTDSAVVISFCN